MQKKSNKEHNHIAYFNPDVTSIEIAHQDFFSEMKLFNAGEGYENFHEFVLKEAIEYKESGDGVTYVVWNKICDENGNEMKREMVAFYTLAATAIPYEDRIRLEKEEAEQLGKEFDSQICGIPALEIKMFAVDEKYQDIFYAYEDEDLPIAAWIMRSIIDYANSLIDNVMGFKAVFLHSLPDAEKFYMANEFNPVEINMQPLRGLDSAFTAMYLTLKEVHMNYDK